MSIKLKRTLYVGIGGTGVETLLKVKKSFIDIYGEVPPMIGFLAIDTDRATNGKSVKSGLGETIKLDRSETLVCSVNGASSIYNINPTKFDWVPRNNVNALSTISAGGSVKVRSNGHFIALYNQKKIEDSIGATITNITHNISIKSKFAVDTDEDGLEQPVYINVVASVAGGTGSGMLIDVLYIIRESVKLTHEICLFPWIVLPEIFKAMVSSPSPDNYWMNNSYEALRELDYFMHYDPKTPAIGFGYGEIKEPLLDYAYLINNTNSAGTTFKTLDDLTDVMAKSMFLTANEMHYVPFWHIGILKMAGAYDILNKRAWTASAGCAELIYDSQAVSRVYAHRTIQQLCSFMLQTIEDGSEDTNGFFYDSYSHLFHDNKEIKIILRRIADKYSNILLEEQQEATATSNSQIFLHTKDIIAALEFAINEKIKLDFMTYLKNEALWIGQTEDYIEEQLWDFAKETPKAKEAVNTDIDNVLRALPEEEVIGYLDHLKLLASPLWAYNTQGYTDTAKELDKFVVVGVGNRDTSILRTNPAYSSLFEYIMNQPSFVSTNQSDRIYVMMMEYLLPIYAVNNFREYEYTHNEIVVAGSWWDNFIDEKLNNRMNSENFSVTPVIEKYNVLWLWVMGFVFDIIHFDNRGDTYWICSKNKGEPTNGYRYDLNKRREVAYDLFKSQQLYKEVEETINNLIAREGRDSFDKKIDEIKRNMSYLAEECQLSRWEKDNLYEPEFKSLRELLEQEVELMTY